MLEVKPVPAFRDNYIWLMIHAGNRTAAIVDPGDAAPVLRALDDEGLTPVAILATHHHGDHVGGIEEILRRFPIPVFGPARESIPGRTCALRDGDGIDIPGLGARFTIIDIPGHTAGHIAYYGLGMVFAGDTLFMSGCGRLFEGTAAQMHASLSRLAALPDDTRVY
ncbi:MAG: hydroxyacylglutathione hydrolase, partial [Gammaproteobacteria bacterium]|nr:hydroxyacylglutathione hydrolase [Gammaproteobacteria bacterium]